MSVTVKSLSHSEALRAKISLVIPEMAATGSALFRHPKLAEILPEYLFVTHCMMRASVPLMQAALDHSRQLAATDPAAAMLAEYFPKHIEEETDHDTWLLEDLEAMGVDAATVLDRPPPLAVASMVGAQYYWIFHYHPVVLLGYIAVMEGYPPAAENIERLAARTPYPRTAFRTMLEHAGVDGDHQHDLYALLDELPLTRFQASAIGANALETVRLGCSTIRGVIRGHEGGSAPRSPPSS